MFTFRVSPWPSHIRDRNSAEVIISAFRKNHLVSSDEEDAATTRRLEKTSDIFTPESSPTEKKKKIDSKNRHRSKDSKHKHSSKHESRSKKRVSNEPKHNIVKEEKILPNDPLIVTICKASTHMKEDCKIIIPEIANEVIVPNDYQNIIQDLTPSRPATNDAQTTDNSNTGPTNYEDAMKQLYAGTYKINYNLLNQDLEISNDTDSLIPLKSKDEPCTIAAPTTDDVTTTRHLETTDGSTSPIRTNTTETGISAVAMTREQASSPTLVATSERATSPIQASVNRATSPIDINELYRNHPNMSLFPRNSQVECKIQ